ncbi:hypothetical protein BRC86_03120 [Halobacteriales archaeon QS_3_64_16]|nr:MAG: hypothetical protein BRC86_03120 [Halobacteriales archaeon QS_3_64_16]
MTVDASSTVQYANDAIEDLFGYSAEELVGESLSAVIPDRLEAAHFEAIDRYVETGEKRLDWEWLELPARHRNGEKFPVGVSFGEYTIDGEPFFTGIIRDITDRKEPEAALERSEDLLDRTQRLTNVGGWELDRATDEQRWTDEVYRIHELPVGDEPDLESALDFYHPEDRRVVEAAVERAIESGEGYDEELRLLTANDEQRWVRTQWEPHFENGEITKIRGAFQDNTEQKFQQRELRSTNSTLSTLLGKRPGRCARRGQRPRCTVRQRRVLSALRRRRSARRAHRQRLSGSRRERRGSVRRRRSVPRDQRRLRRGGPRRSPARCSNSRTGGCSNAAAPLSRPRRREIGISGCITTSPSGYDAKQSSRRFTIGPGR